MADRMTEADINAIESRARAALPYERSVLGAVDRTYNAAGARPAEPEPMECPLCDGDGQTDTARYDAKTEHASTIAAFVPGGKRAARANEMRINPHGIDGAAGEWLRGYEAGNAG